MVFRNSACQSKTHNYLQSLTNLWEGFPLGFYHESPPDMLLEFYQRIDDSMTMACIILYSKSPNSFKTKREKLEATFGDKILSSEAELVNQARRVWAHEKPKERLDQLEKKEFVDNYLRDINIIPQNIDYAKEDHNKLTCVWLYYDFLKNLTEKTMDISIQQLLKEVSIPGKEKEIEKIIRGKIKKLISIYKDIIIQVINTSKKVRQEAVFDIEIKGNTIYLK